MAFTKVVGAGIHTLSNITSHNINSSGIITATKFVGPIEAVDGTFTGNVTIGGTLTYEDVKNVDSVGLITARSGINVIGHSELDNLNVSGVSTFSGIATASSTLFAKNFSTSGIGTFADIHVKSPVDTRITSIAPGALILSRNTPVILFKNNLSDTFDASIDVVSNELRFKGGGNNATSTRMVTTSSGVSFPQNIDVDGHTELDNVNISGVTTTTRLDISSTTPIIDLIETDGNPDYRIYAEGGEFVVRQQNPSVSNRLVINSTGVSIPNNLFVSGISTFTGRIDASDNIAITSGNRLYFGNSDVAFIKGEHGASGYLAFGANNEVMRMTRSGRLGIGTANPQVMHHLYSASGGLYTRFESTNSQVNFGNSNGAGIIQVTSTSQPLRILVNGTNERLRIDSSGRILTNGETATEVTAGGIHVKTVNDGANSNILILENHGSTSDTTVTLKFVPSTSTPNDRYNSIKAINVDGQNKFDTVFHTCPGGTPLEAMRIDNQQRVIIGTQYTDTRHEVGDAALQVSGTGPSDSAIAVGRWSNNNQPAFLELSKSRATSITGHTAVQADDILGQVQFSGSDGTRYLGAAFVKGIATNPIADYDVAGYLSFGTNYGTTSPTERLRIKSDGKVIIGNPNGSGTGALTIYPNSITGNGRLDIYGGGDENSQNAARNEVMRIGRGDILDQYYHSIWSATGSGGATSHFLKFYVSNGTAGATNQLEALSMNGNGQVQIPQTTQSTVTTNGALVVSGGVGVAKNIICGGALEVQNNTLTVTSATPNILMAVPSGGLDSRIYNDGSGNFIIGHGTNSNAPTERLKIESDGTIRLNDNNIELHGTGTADSTAFDNAGWEKLVFAPQYSDVARGPNKIVLQNDTAGGGWFSGFGIHTNTLAIYSGGDTVFQQDSRNSNHAGNTRMIIRESGGTVINKGGTTHADSGYAGLEVKANSNEHHLLLSSIANASNSNYSTLGFKLHPSNQNERIKAAIQVQGSGGGYGEASRMMFCLDNVADNGNAQGNSVDERFRISPTTGVQVHRDKFGWSTFGHYTGSARTLLRHVKEFGTGSSAATFNLIRVRRHYWGWGHYKFTIKRGYYSGIAEDVYYLNGHGRDDGSYNPSYSIGQRQYNGHGSNFGYSGRITITSPSTSSPGSSYAAYVDVRLECPAYMYFHVEVEAYASTYSTDYTSLASDQYALI